MFGQLAVHQSKTQHQQRDAHKSPSEDRAHRPGHALVDLLRVNLQEILLFICHFRNDDADLVHPALSGTLQDHFVCGGQAFILADIYRMLKLSQFSFYQWLQDLDAFLLIRIVVSETP